MIQSVPNSIYLQKYIDININGKWKGDNIRADFGISYVILENSEKFCEVASKYGEAEIKSVFKFIFDSPLPKNKRNEGILNSLISELKKCDESLAYKLTESYNEVLYERQNH